MHEHYPDFCENAINVYRTKNYIVKQCLGIKFGCEEDNVTFSHDTYYARNKKRDKEYEKYFEGKKNINGKRLPTMMYARTYVD